MSKFRSNFSEAVNVRKFKGIPLSQNVKIFCEANCMSQCSEEALLHNSAEQLNYQQKALGLDVHSPQKFFSNIFI